MNRITNFTNLYSVRNMELHVYIYIIMALLVNIIHAHAEQYSCAVGVLKCEA